MCISMFPPFREEPDSDMEDEDEGDGDPSLSDQKVQEERFNMTVCYFFFSIVWSIGVSVDSVSRDRY